jgi:glutaminyl-peptide cyclotransferase
MSHRIRLVVLLALAAACGAGNAAPVKEFDGKLALDRIGQQVAFGPRIPGQPGHARTAAWIDSISRTQADSVTVQRFWYHPAKGDSVEMINVLAQFNPKAAQRVLYVAHWDSKPFADRDPTNKTAPMPGADDGGSGVAVLRGVADALHKLRPDVGVDLLYVDGEDFGDFGPPEVDVLVGAAYYAKHPLAANPMFGVLWDMVGHKDLRISKEQNSQVAAPEIVDRVWAAAEQMGYGAIFTQNKVGMITDDHIPLINAGIRTIDIIDLGYPYWHTTQDTPDKESAQSLEAVGNVAVAVVRRALK